MTQPSTPTDEWYASKGQLNDDEPATPEEVEALKSFIEDKASPETAAKRLMTTREDKKSLEDKTNRVAWLLFDLAMDFPDQQSRVFELLEAIKALPDEQLAFTDEQKLKYSDWKSWKDLERFWDIVDEMRRSYWAYRLEQDGEDDDPEANPRKWARINALMARHVARYGGTSELAYGLSVIRNALETEPWNKTGGDEAREKERLKFLSADVPAAAGWLIYAGEEVFDSLKSGSTEIKIEPSDLWSRSDSGVSRWNLWKERLNWVWEQQSLADEIRQIAKNAYTSMQSVEDRR
ncbi:hypothetical protein B0J12DRAFT_783684 [Macrophomina phaseolina]|uniref:Uncharacterized protein n=1 Tax=Macrophomina phaseolina TaxID=35725 RepID=A0ABQ8GJ21_9PEZI|nr:hypothetical protein B0J12DRAFT_783684 [Macrophomina phaseolina]